MHSYENIGENPTPAANTVAVGTKVASNLDQYDALGIVLSYQGPTGGALNITLQDSFDGGETWNDYFRTNDIAAASGAAVIHVSPKAMSGAVQTVGTGTKAPAAATPALTKGTVREGPWGGKMRAVYEMGAGLSGFNGTIGIQVRGSRAR